MCKGTFSSLLLSISIYHIELKCWAGYDISVYFKRHRHDQYSIYFIIASFKFVIISYKVSILTSITYIHNLIDRYRYNSIDKLDLIQYYNI